MGEVKKSAAAPQKASNLPSLEGRGTACGGRVPMEVLPKAKGIEKPYISERKKDFSTHRSCSDS
jgi:hypothetical protein